MNNLIQNEMLKLLARKRLIVVGGILAILVVLFTYAQYQTVQTQLKKLGTTDWRTTLQQQIIDTQNRLANSRIPDDFKKELEVRVKQQQYYLDNDINPAEPGAPSFTKEFMENSIDLLLPLMIMVIASDLVSSEFSMGSIKLLLTRPVKRWKILLSKYITLLLAISLIIAMMGLVSYLISGVVFGYKGWTAPAFSGFRITEAGFDSSGASIIPQWQFILMDFGVVWFAAVVVGTLSFMVSVLIRSTAAGMGIILALLIAGAILSNMVSSWTSAKYFFMLNMRLTDYLNGSPPPIEGMTLSFSLLVLTVWWLLALVISFTVFTKKDIY
ncbi:ABC transporter permease [Peribacillus deserti]|uniref:ABC transporter permease n=1 Tax=Peribacillus deserti TaxID=673318 RepID=A0A2N5MAR5_9BACI|nr:ABC transporter permease subunit [Peribacillus deserti]PLT31417.1 ABC transporter permease [Peribacillus deserti]